MIIVLEGPRGTGKTATAKELVKVLAEMKYSPTIAKFKRGDNPTEDMIASLNEFQSDIVKDPRRAVIVDRFHLTEYVMRSVDGSVPRSKLFTNMVRLSTLLQNMGAWVVTLECDEEERRTRVKNRNDGRDDEPWDVMRVWAHLHVLLCDYNGKPVFNNTFVVDTTTRTAESVAKIMMVQIGVRAEYLTKYVHLG